MKFAALVLKSALRNKRRTILTVLGLGLSLFLVVTLYAVLQQLRFTSVAAESDLRMWTRHAVSFNSPLPLAYREQIRQVPGVREVMVGNLFFGIYRDERSFFPNAAVEPDKGFKVYPELKIASEQLENFVRERTAAVAGIRLFERFGWKIGDRIVLKGTMYPVDVELKLVGSFTSPNPPDEAALWFRYDYLDELIGRPGLVGTFIIRAESAEAMPGIARAVDEKFRNSAAPTRTETEKAFALAFSKMMGNVKLLLGGVSAVVLFTILLVTGATMSMTIRERTAEVAVMKTLGYTRGMILALLLAEGLLVAVLGGLLGCGGAKLLYTYLDIQRVTGVFLLPRLQVRPEALALGMGLAAAIGLVAALVPALHASRQPIAEAIRHVG